MVSLLLTSMAERQKQNADIAKVLTLDEARRIASDIAKLPALLGADKEP